MAEEEGKLVSPFPHPPPWYKDKSFNPPVIDEGKLAGNMTVFGEPQQVTLTVSYKS